MTPNEIIAARLDRIDAIPEKFIYGVSKIQSEIYAELLTLLSELSIGESFDLTTANLIRIDTIMQEYYTALKDGKYGSYVNWYMNELKKQQALSDDYFKAEFAITANEVSKGVYAASRNKAIRVLLGDDFKTNFINVVKDQVIGSLQGKADFSELKKDLFGLFHDVERQPQMMNWTKQVSVDVFAQADRAYNDSIARENDLVFFEYSGGLIKDSRDFCRERDGQYFHVREAQEWVPLNWAGKFRNTTAQNILIVMGGYRCQHVPAYRSLVNIPIEVIQRNIASGNFVPSAAEKSLLNL